MSKLTNYAKIILGGTPSTNRPDFWDGEIPWVSVVDFTYSKKIYTTEKTITESGLNQSNTKLLNEGDIIVSARGTVGKVAVCGGKMAFNQSCYALLSKDNNKLNQNFLFYLLQEKVKYLRQMSVGGVFNTIIKSTLEKIPVELPDILTQEKIADILSNYDDLIDTNRRRIQLLEESARLLFREWFVYFRFPRLRQGYDGQAGHEKVHLVRKFDSNGVKIVNRDGRKIPSEWDYLPFTKIKIFKKAPLGVPVFTDIRQYYQTSEIDGTSITGNGEEVDYENRPSRANIAPRINTIYFAKMKDTDKVLYFNKGNTYLLEKVLLSTGMVGFTTDEKYLGFLFGLLTSYEFVQYKNNFATGATQVSLNDASLKKIKVLFPTLNLVELYSEIVNPLLEECSLLRSQNQKLAQARDLLLPRLMSGEIDPVR